MVVVWLWLWLCCGVVWCESEVQVPAAVRELVDREVGGQRGLFSLFAHNTQTHICGLNHATQHQSNTTMQHNQVSERHAPHHSHAPHRPDVIAAITNRSGAFACVQLHQSHNLCLLSGAASAANHARRLTRQLNKLALKLVQTHLQRRPINHQHSAVRFGAEQIQVTSRIAPVRIQKLENALVFVDQTRADTNARRGLRLNTTNTQKT